MEKFNIDKLQYSGWNFDNICKKCVKYEVENKYLPIYIQCINDENYVNVMSIIDRNESDKISILINLAKLNTIKNHKAILAHEFRHLLEMYIDSDKSHIDDEIYKLDDSELKNHRYFDLVKTNCEFVCIF